MKRLDPSKMTKAQLDRLGAEAEKVTYADTKPLTAADKRSLARLADCSGCYSPRLDNKGRARVLFMMKPALLFCVDAFAKARGMGRSEVISRASEQFMKIHTSVEGDLPPLPKPGDDGTVDAIAFGNAATAQYIIKRRHIAGINRQDLAHLAGVRLETLARAESGKHNSSVRVLDKIELGLRKAAAVREGLDQVKRGRVSKGPDLARDPTKEIVRSALEVMTPTKSNNTPSHVRGLRCPSCGAMRNAACPVCQENPFNNHTPIELIPLSYKGFFGRRTHYDHQRDWTSGEVVSPSKQFRDVITFGGKTDIQIFSAFKGSVDDYLNMLEGENLLSHPKQKAPLFKRRKP